MWGAPPNPQTPMSNLGKLEYFLVMRWDNWHSDLSVWPCIILFLLYLGLRSERAYKNNVNAARCSLFPFVLFYRVLVSKYIFLRRFWVFSKFQIFTVHTKIKTFWKQSMFKIISKSMFNHYQLLANRQASPAFCSPFGYEGENSPLSLVLII